MSVITVSLPSETERKLREKARAAGLNLESYLADRLERLAEQDAPLTAPRTFDEILAPVRAGFAAGGLTEDELTDLFREERGR